MCQSKNSHFISGVIPIFLLSLQKLCFIFQNGFGSVSWLVAAEILPSEVRTLAYPVIVASTWLFNFALSHSYGFMNEAVGREGTLWIYAALSALGVVFIVVGLPETKAKTDEEISVFFANPSNQTVEVTSDNTAVSPEQCSRHFHDLSYI